jgi:hypothetical protein
MKIISLSANIAGFACSIAISIKKYFYNNNYITNIFDYLELSIKSINQFLLLNEEDIKYINFEDDWYVNHKNNVTIKFKNFHNIYSHHDLNNNFTIYDYDELKQKYIRRYQRLINDIKTEDKIFFLRYGIEDSVQIELFYENIRKKNPKLIFYYIMLVYSENPVSFNIKYNNFIVINFYDFIDKKIKYDNDPFNRVLQYNWKEIYNILEKYMNINDKKNLELNFME